MFKSIYNDIKDQINFGNNITRLIIINVVVFIALYVVFAFVALTAGPGYKDVQQSIVDALSIPSQPMEILKKPWTILTHMFLHQRPGHMIFNMLGLYYFGRIFGDLLGDRRVVPLYLLSGLMGALFFVIGMNFLGIYGPAKGASAALLGLLIGATIVNPDHNFRLPFLGDIKLKYIALFYIVMGLIGVAGFKNTGGHFGHAGGMVMGWIFIGLINTHRDPSPWFHNVYESIVGLWDNSKSKKPKSPLKVRHKASVGRRSKAQNTQGPSAPVSEEVSRLDAILDKISKTGIDSLTPEEKAFLDNASKDN